MSDEAERSSEPGRFTTLDTSQRQPELVTAGSRTGPGLPPATGYIETDAVPLSCGSPHSCCGPADTLRGGIIETGETWHPPSIETLGTR